MAGKTNYKQQLIQVQELRGEGGKNAYKRATILTKVFDNRQFRSESGAMDDYQAAELLDSYVEDLCLNFLQLRAMLKEFPEEKDWSDGRIKTLYDKVLDKAEQRQRDEQPERKRKSVKWKDYEQVLKQKEDADYQAERAEKQVEQTKSEVEKLREECQRLREENAALKGRVEELRQLLSEKREPEFA